LPNLLLISHHPFRSPGRIALLHLQSKLESDRKQLLQLLEHNKPLLIRTAWVLLRLCMSTTAVPVILLAASCLGELGVVSLVALPGAAEVARAPAAAGDGSGKPVKLSRHVQIVRRMVLQITNFLVDESVSVIRASSTCMRALLATPHGGEAFRLLDKETQDSLYPFRPSSAQQAKKAASPAVVVPSQPPSPGGSAAALSDAVWSTQGKSYELWIRQLVASLCKLLVGPSTEYIALSAAICERKSTLAEFLFPHIINALAEDEAQRVGKASARARPFLLELASAAEREVLRDVRSGTMAVQLVLSAMRAHLDKWTAAEAALRCSLYVSALMFLEMSAEREFGALKLPEADLEQGAQPKRAAYLSMLRKIFRNIDEPDSLHGMPPADDAEALSIAILLYEHDERWEDALSCYDRALAHLPSAVAHLPGAAVVGQRVELRTGLLRALGNLGHLHLSASYLSSVGGSSVEEMAELSEQQLELAWRTCQWGDHASPQLDSLLSNRHKVTFHQATLQCVRALSDADENLFFAGLDGIRLELLSGLAASVSENTKCACCDGGFAAVMLLCTRILTPYTRHPPPPTTHTHTHTHTHRPIRALQPLLARLRFFREIESCWAIRNAHGSEKHRLLRLLDAEWCTRNKLTRDMTFEEKERLMSLRIALLGVGGV
jgi:hypothetical protein